MFGIASLVGRVYSSSAGALLIVGAAIGAVLSLTLLLPMPLGWLPFEAAVACWALPCLRGGATPPSLSNPHA